MNPKKVFTVLYKPPGRLSGFLALFNENYYFTIIIKYIIIIIRESFRKCLSCIVFLIKLRQNCFRTARSSEARPQTKLLVSVSR